LSSEGFLDTNVVVHAFTNDPLSRECMAFLEKLESGERSARLEIFVVHELSYILPRYLKQLSRAEIGRILEDLLGWPGVIVSDRELLIEAISRWSRSQSLGFVDSLLISQARSHGLPIFTKNVREMSGFGVEIPSNLG
jgi:predicted nucleic acid-binding protein